MHQKLAWWRINKRNVWRVLAAICQVILSSSAWRTGVGYSRLQCGGLQPTCVFLFSAGLAVVCLTSQAVLGGCATHAADLTQEKTASR